jgi:hypothetical protein
MFYVLNMHLNGFWKMLVGVNKCYELFQVDESRTLIRSLVTSSDGTLKCNNHYKILHCKNHIFPIIYITHFT